MLGVGSVVDNKYKILSEIGHGGMSVVYLAINERANKTWAIKEVRKDGGNNSEVVQQGLVAETEMLKKLHHEHLPSIIDVIDRDESFLIVMDYIEGKSLESLLKHGGAQDPELVIEWSKQLCDVLGYLHSRTPAIIYRDMKPANVMLKPSGDVTLIDFGTAREYKEHSQGDTTWLGTRGYAAPEQFGGRGQTDGRTDIYCLGATMYHLLTGYSPAETNFVILPLSQLNPTFAGTGIEKIVAKCCQPAPEDRYQSCAELMYALEHVHDEDDIVVRRRNLQWGGFLACIIVFLLSVAGMIGFKLAANDATTKSYDYFIAQAKNVDTSTDIEQATLFYQKAMKLRPSSPDAYLELLESIENDITFTAAENTMLQSCILDTDGGVRTNLNSLQESNRAAYSDFCYRLANDYYFFYEGPENRTKAAEWYSRVLESDYLTDQQRQLANSLYTIGNYYQKLDSDKSLMLTGSENSANYLTFWDQMSELTDGDLVSKTGGARYAVALYREMLYQIFTNGSKFKAYGVPAASVNAKLDQIESALGTLTPETSMIAAQITEAQQLLQQARQQSATIYASTGG